MPTIPPAKLASLPDGVFVVGRAIGDFKIKNIKSAKGHPMTFVEGKILAGETFCTVSEKLEDGEGIYCPKHNEEVRAFVVPDYRQNDVFVSSVRFSRPEVDGKK